MERPSWSFAILGPRSILWVHPPSEPLNHGNQISPEKWCLEDKPFLLGRPIFQGLAVKFPGCILPPKKKTTVTHIPWKSMGWFKMIHFLFQMSSLFRVKKFVHFRWRYTNLSELQTSWKASVYTTVTPETWPDEVWVGSSGWVIFGKRTL